MNRPPPPPLFAPAAEPTGTLDQPLTRVAGELLSRKPAPPPAQLPPADPAGVPVDEPFAARVDRRRKSGTTGRPTEGAVVKEILGWLEVQPHARARKVHQSAVTGKGEPDLDICWQGRAVKIEVKRPGERLRPDQLRRLLWWQEAGALVGWVTSLEDLRAILAHVADSDWRQSAEQLNEPGA